jgi:hypothetical protein
VYKREFGSDHYVREARKAKTRDLGGGIEEGRAEARMEGEQPSKIGGKKTIKFLESREGPRGEGCSVAGLGDDAGDGNLDLEKRETRASKEGREVSFDVGGGKSQVSRVRVDIVKEDAEICGGLSEWIIPLSKRDGRCVIPVPIADNERGYGGAVRVLSAPVNLDRAELVCCDLHAKDNTEGRYDVCLSL